MSPSLRRLMMSACVVGGVVALWPALAARAEEAPADEAVQAPADVPATAAPATPPAVVYPQVNMAGFSREYRAIPINATKAGQAIHVALRAPMKHLVDFQETPLRAVLSHFRDSTGLPMVCDMQALSDAGIDPETPVTQDLARLPGVSVASALRLVLHDMGLTWVVRDEVLTVTTREKAQENLVVVAYPLPRGLGDGRPADGQSMIDLIQSTVAAQTWDVVGGPGAIKPLESAGELLLIVSQTSEIHDEVENLLRRVHERQLAEFAEGRPVLRVHHVADRDARVGLRDALKSLCNASLGDRGDEAAEVTIVGDSVSVVAKSPEFHALAAQTIAAVAGVPRNSAPPPPALP